MVGETQPENLTTRFKPLPGQKAKQGDGDIYIYNADGQLLTQIGLFQPAAPTTLQRAPGLRFDPGGDILPVEEPTLVQGFLEDSNVDPILEVTRLIEVQRAYENGRNLLSNDHERIRSLIETLGK